MLPDEFPDLSEQTQKSSGRHHERGDEPSWPLANRADVPSPSVGNTSDEPSSEPSYGDGAIFYTGFWHSAM